MTVSLFRTLFRIPIHSVHLSKCVAVVLEGEPHRHVDFACATPITPVDGSGAHSMVYEVGMSEPEQESLDEIVLATAVVDAFTRDPALWTDTVLARWETVVGSEEFSEMSQLTEDQVRSLAIQTKYPLPRTTADDARDIAHMAAALWIVTGDADRSKRFMLFEIRRMANGNTQVAPDFKAAMLRWSHDFLEVLGPLIDSHRRQHAPEAYTKTVAARQELIHSISDTDTLLQKLKELDVAMDHSLEMDFPLHWQLHVSARDPQRRVDTSTSSMMAAAEQSPASFTDRIDSVNRFRGDTRFGDQVLSRLQQEQPDLARRVLDWQAARRDRESAYQELLQCMGEQHRNGAGLGG